jgi:hypothetical protein
MMRLHGTRARCAFLSDDVLGPDGRGQYRYLLWRWWGPGRNLAVFVMLNPSTADEKDDDPTMREVERFARAWGFDGVLVANLFALRSPHPSALKIHRSPVGPENSRALAAALRHADFVVVAWGSHPWPGKADDMRRWLLTERPVLHCLGTTADGSPKHPLARGKSRIPRDQEPILWRTRTGFGAP